MSVLPSAGGDPHGNAKTFSRADGPRRRRHANRAIAATATCTLAAAALAAGFADHAHLTRTYRAYLGRTPSEFKAPPDVVAPW